jgi:hypothetical protein
MWVLLWLSAMIAIIEDNFGLFSPNGDTILLNYELGLLFMRNTHSPNTHYAI